MLSWDSELAGCGQCGQILGSSIFPWTLGFFNCHTCVSIWSPWLAISCAPGVTSLIDNTHFVLGEVQRCMLWPPPSGTISSDLTKITVTRCYWAQGLSALWTLSPNSRGIWFCFKLLGFPGSSASKRIHLQCKRPGFNPRVGMIPKRREWISAEVSRWQSRRSCAHFLLQELQNYNSLLSNRWQKNVGSHQKKIPHIKGKRRSPSKMVGGVKSSLESNPIPARDAWRAQTNLVCTRN